MDTAHRQSFDVTVSVWNEFHAAELCEGLAREGFRVLALRSEWPPLAGVSSKTSELSRILTRLFQKTQWHPLLEAAQNCFESFASRQIGRSSVFWGWNGHNFRAFERAKAAGQRVLCERGSTHAAWANRRLKEVHEKLGLGITETGASRRDAQALAEYQLADMVIVPSEFVRDTFLAEGLPEEKLFVNPYGIDDTHWRRVDGMMRDKGPLVFVFTASMTPRKGVHILLRAWKKANLRDCELWLCGGVHFPLGTAGVTLDETIKLQGYMPHDKLVEIYNRASVYVLPSFEEGMARSGLEAMASGLPLIVTRETGLTDVMEAGRHGWVVQSGDEDSLVEALRHVAEDRGKLAQFGAEARAKGLTCTKRAYGDRAARFLRRFLEESL